MPTALIVDDEKKAAENLCLLLQEHCPSIQICASVHSAREGYEKIKEHSPEIVFLDVNMPFSSGFDMLELIPNPSFEIIFVTAYDKYAIEAFKVNAIDYLLKPIDIKLLQKAVQKAEKRINEKHVDPDAIKKLLNSLKKDSKIPKIAISSQEGISYVDSDLVTYLSADSNYTHVYLNDGKKYTISKTLKDIENTLPDSFFRIHIATVVNLKHIDKYVRGEGGYVIMNNGISLEVAKRRKQELLERLA